MRPLTDWLFPVERPERLAAVRIGLCAVLFLRLTRTVYVELADQPAALFRPRSFMNLFPSMPPRSIVIAVQIVALLAAAAALIGWRVRATLPIAIVTSLFLNGMATSLGKVVHNDVLLTLCLFALLPSRCADAWAIDARGSAAPSRDYGWPLRAMLVIVAGSYFFSGLHKLINSGPAWVFGDNMRWVMYQAAERGAEPNHVSLAIADRPWLAQLVAAAILLLELSFPIVLWLRRARAPYVAAAIAFHLGTWMTIGLNYWAQAATVAIVLLAPSLRVRAAMPVDGDEVRDERLVGALEDHPE